MDPSTLDPPRSPSPDLSGWKEIAAYLGKSVRAVQRWERELGLPVRRMKTSAGQVVFAKRDEIDAWRRGHELPPNGSPAEPCRAAARSWQRSVTVRWLAATAAVAVVTLGTGWALRAGSRAPASFRMTATGVEALDAGGNVVWARDVDPHLVPLELPRLRGLRSQIIRADIDGDGTPEVLVVAHFETAPVVRSDRLLCFTESGRLLWNYEPTFTLSFQGGSYEQPWGINDVAVGGPGKRQRIWVALSHTTWWASAVVELDTSGHATTRYIQSGAVYAIASARINGAWRLVAAGVNNEYARAAIAILDPDGAAASPQSPASPYRCTACPAGGPLRYILLPLSDLARATGMPYNRATGLFVANEDVNVFSNEAPDLAADVLYRLSPDARIRDAKPTDGFWVAHQRAADRLRHSADACPERAPARVMRVWSPQSGWREEQTLAPAGVGSGDSD